MNSDNATSTESAPLRTGVIGVGAMGENHARLYSELQTVDLVGVSDLDTEQAARVAAEYGTEARSLESLLEACDAVTVAVPTAAHHETVGACLDAGVHVLVEKPVAETRAQARDLAQRAREAELVLQVGHIERFNPAVQTLAELIDDFEIIAIEAERLGPPVDRMGGDSVAKDLMIHDVDVVNSLLGGDPETIAATGTAAGQHTTATLQYDNGVLATLTASRVTQKKVRRLTITARECHVEVDYLEQRVRIFRKSLPEYVTDNGQNRFRHESIIERPRVENREPLRCEIESFLEAVRTGSEPEVTAEDGLRALETVRTIDRLVADIEELEVASND